MHIKENAYTQFVLRAITHIEANLSEPPKLEDLAKEAGLSMFHLHRIFHASTGSTPKQWQMNARWSKARELLLKSGLPVVDIALLLGYANPESFSRAFKAEHGQSPLEYKARPKVYDQPLEHSNHAQTLYKDYVPKIVQLSSETYVSLRHTGSYKLVAFTWAKLRLLTMAAGISSGHVKAFGIIHDDPFLTDADKNRYDACLNIGKNHIKFSLIKESKIQSGKYAQYVYQGPYDHFYDVYAAIFDNFLNKNGLKTDLRPTMEVYIQGPPKFKPDQFITEFYIPVAS